MQIILISLTVSTAVIILLREAARLEVMHPAAMTVLHNALQIAARRFGYAAELLFRLVRSIGSYMYLLLPSSLFDARTGRGAGCERAGGSGRLGQFVTVWRTINSRSSRSFIATRDTPVVK